MAGTYRYDFRVKICKYHKKKPAVKVFRSYPKKIVDDFQELQY